MENKKNSQLSIFIIFSIILVVVTIFLISLNSYDLFRSEDTQLENQVSKLVESCIKDSATNGINLLALQGGFLQIREDVLKNKKRHLDIGIKIPTWDVERNYLPSISLMESQLNIHIKKDAESCIKSEFKSLDKFVDYKFTDKMNIDTIILDDYLTIKTFFPINFNQKNSDNKLYIEEFNVEIEKVRLGKIFKLAKKIFEKQTNTNFFEELIMEQIYGASDYNSRESLPTEGLHFSCNKKIYKISDLKKNLAKINNANFKFLQIKNTKSNYLIETLKKSDNSFYKYYENTYKKDLGIDSSYLDFSIGVIKPIKNIFKNNTNKINYMYRTFGVTPGNKVITQAEEFKTSNLGIKLPCLQIFSHKYDLDYDLLLTIVDNNENNDRFKFQFPIRIQIKKNKPKVGNLFYFEKQKSQLQSTYCQKENRANPTIIKVKDTNNNYLKDVEVEYSCLNYDCEMKEKTKKPLFLGFEMQEEDPQIKINLPYCIGGSLKATKKGYFQHSKKIINTEYTILDKKEDKTEMVYDIDLVKVITLPTKKNSFLLIDGIKGFYPSNKIESGEEIYLEVINKKLGFRSEVIFPDKIENYKNLKLLDLKDTPYDVNIYYTKNGSLLGFFQTKDVILNPRDGNNYQIKFPITNKEIDETNYENYIKDIKLGVDVGKYRFTIFN